MDTVTKGTRTHVHTHTTQSTDLVWIHGRAFPVVEVILQVPISDAKLQLLQKHFILHQIQGIEHIKAFLLNPQNKHRIQPQSVSHTNLKQKVTPRGLDNPEPCSRYLRITIIRITCASCARILGVMLHWLASNGGMGLLCGMLELLGGSCVCWAACVIVPVWPVSVHRSSGPVEECVCERCRRSKLPSGSYGEGGASLWRAGCRN